MGALIYICIHFLVRNGLNIVSKPIGILVHLFTKIRSKIEITVTKKGVPVDQF